MTPYAPDFDALEDARRRLDTLAETSLASMSEFALYQPTKGGPACFAHHLGDVGEKDAPGKRCSVGTTATSLSTIMAAKPWLDGQLDAHGASFEDLIRILVSLVDERNWQKSPDKPGELKLPQNNAFDISFAVEAAAHTLTNLPPDALERYLADAERERIAKVCHEAVVALCATLQNSPSQGARIDENPENAFLSQLAMRGLLAWITLLDSGIVPASTKARYVYRRLKPLRAWAVNHARTHLTHLLTKSPHGDVWELVHAVLIFASIRADGHRNESGRFLDGDEKRIAVAAFDYLAEAQLPNGAWPLGRPLFHYNRKGDAYCYPYEVLAQALQCPALTSILRRHFDMLQRALDHAEESAIQDASKPNVRLWASGHAPGNQQPEGWSTAATHQFLHHLRYFIAERIREENFQHFRQVQRIEVGYATRTPKHIESEMLDATIQHAGGRASFTETLIEGIIERLRSQALHVSNGGRYSKSTPVSILLYGPPGTSKTQTAKMIAKYLGWPFLSIDPSHFLSEGHSAVQAQATDIFRRLANTDQIVVLLDEIDELVRQRGDDESPESRFLTTSMLPRLIDINESRRIVFIVATNHIEHFDLAISREGRFDVALQVMPPSLTAKANPKLRAFRDEGRASMKALAKRLSEWKLKPWTPTYGHVGLVIEAMTYAEYNRLAQDVEIANPTDEELVKMIAHRTPSLTMFQPREWHLPESYSQAHEIPGLVGEAGISVEGVKLTLDAHTVDGGSPAPGERRHVTWHRVYRMPYMHRKNRLPPPVKPTSAP